MGVGESSWVKGKRPVKFVRFSKGTLFRRAGWYFLSGRNRFRLSSDELQGLLKKEKAFLLMDEESIEKLAARYRGAERRDDAEKARVRELRRREEKAEALAKQQEERARKAEALAKRRKAEAEKLKRESEALAKRVAKS